MVGREGFVRGDCSAVTRTARLGHNDATLVATRRRPHESVYFMGDARGHEVPETVWAMSTMVPGGVQDTVEPPLETGDTVCLLLPGLFFYHL